MTTSTSATAPLCLACGEHTVKKDRRVLGGTSERVTLLWKETISSELEKRKEDVDLDELLCPGPGYMCRKCFYAYDKMLQNKEVGI